LPRRMRAAFRLSAAQFGREVLERAFKVNVSFSLG